MELDLLIMGMEMIELDLQIMQMELAMELDIHVGGTGNGIRYRNHEDGTIQLDLHMMVCLSN